MDTRLMHFLQFRRKGKTLPAKVAKGKFYANIRAISYVTKYYRSEIGTRGDPSEFIGLVQKLLDQLHDMEDLLHKLELEELELHELGILSKEAANSPANKWNC